MFIMEDIKQQIKEYSELIKKYPDVKELRIERAKLYDADGQYKKAVEDFKKTLTGYYCFENIIKVCEEAGLTEEAERLYIKAIEADKENICNYLEKIYFHMRQKEFEKALADCKKVLKLFPKNETISTLKRVLTGK